MDDGNETAELAGMGDVQENITLPPEQAADAQPVEQAMTDVNDDMDSRTSLAGRKRNLQESSHDHAANSEEENDERSRKRVKDHQDPPLDQEPLETNIASPSIRVSSPLRVEVDQSHQPPASEPAAFRPQETEKSPAPGDHSLVGTGSVAYEPAPAPFGNTQPVASWNGGVSSSLRTSFGSKPQALSSLKSISTDVIGLQDTTTQLADPVGGGSLASTIDANPPVVAPFRELTRVEQDNLSGEEKNLYLKSLFASLRTPTPRQADTPRVTSYPSSHADSSAQDYEDDTEEAPAATTLGKVKPFQKLGKAARQRLDPKARAAYDIALQTHYRDKRERKRQKKANSLEHQTNLPRGTSLNPPPNRENHPSSSEESHGEEENDTSMDTSLDETRQTDLSKRPVFRKLKKSQRRALSQEDRDAYDRAREIHLAAKRLEAKRAKKQAKVTAAREGQKLPEGTSKERQLQLDTEKAEAAIAKLYPLSTSDYEFEIATSIAEGKTMYPRKPARPPIYTNKFGSWDLPELLTVDGKPLHIRDFYFNKFAPQFLSLYPDSWKTFNQRMLVGAFGTYLSSYYSHLLGTGPALEICRATPTNGDAIKIEKAKHLANQLLGQNVPSQVPQTAPGIRDHTQIISAPAITSDQQPSMHADDNVDMVMDDAADDIASVIDEDMELTATSIDDEEPIYLELSQAELYLQQKYYPSSDLTIMHCLACSRKGHNTLDCPFITCRVCGTSGVHSEAMCPLKKLCQKCRERGHETNNCKEKLSLPKSEMSCDICGLSDHLEMACHYVWRSFDPRPEEILTVREILVDCYTCGFSDHFGPECGLHRGMVYSGGLTWSKENLEKYLDPSSKNRALSAGVDYSIPGRAPKKGNATDLITIDESDEESFIRPKVPPTHPKGGKIQVKPLQQNQQVPQPKKKQKKKKGPRPEVVDPAYHRDPNPPRASRPNFSPNQPFSNAPQNPPTGPRAGTNNNSGKANRGNANRGGRGGGRGGAAAGGGRGGGGGLSKADRRRMADQAGARNALGQF
ncbi:hypothetical protein BKA61DRAFT_538845 [Leptodontidium sp. MPI-SDFR-AT-0119]|nr:hypothetical protein BKA61DRAFT_538845 [Leptodontidium sp. MPI-SDFR-AT-0119]